MHIGFIGLGKMGAAMVQRLLEHEHAVVATDLDSAAVKRAQRNGAIGVPSVEALVKALPKPRVIWLMVPHGDPVDAVLRQLTPCLSTGDVVIDGGNSHYTDSVRRGKELTKKGVHFVDIGTSGGLEGAAGGACLMVGGEDAAVQRIWPLLKSLAQPDGVAHVGPVGAGHYVKMVHNGVEYAMVQAYGEGFELLRNAPYDYDLSQVADNWNHGSIVRSYVLGLAAQQFKRDPDLRSITDEVGGGSTGEWTVEASMQSHTAIPTIYAALAARYHSRRPESFTTKVVAALRNAWGGHEVGRAKKKKK